MRELPLDPDGLPRPLPPPGRRDFIICGAPRTGTTLLAAQLFQPPSVITVMEPWDGMRLPPAELFASLREEIDRTGRLTRGKLDVGALRTSGTVRWQQEGKTDVALPEPSAEYMLGVKWTTYWRYLALLPQTKFLVCLRHPLETISSYKKKEGRLTRGLDYETRFNQKMNDTLQSAADSPALRRIFLYDYINERLLPFLEKPNVFAVRYERWFRDPDALMKELGDFLDVELRAGPASIRTPQSKQALTESEVALAREHCRTAEALGYDLNQASLY